MSKTPTAVYTCRQPDLLDAYDQSTTDLWEEYRAKIKALEQEWGVDTLLCSSGSRGQFITGYVAPTRDEAPKPGFRREAHSDYMKPALRTKAGKAVAERLRDVAYEPPKKPGLPDMVWGEGYMGQFSLRQLGGTWFAYTTVPLGDRDPNYTGLNEVDPALWEPAKLSEYFLALEAEG
jgi:hypothetical protein